MKPLANPSLHASRQADGAQNRSLERGIEILRAFRPGSDLLGNGEIAERTGIARATVSRLTQTLVMSGMLDYDPNARAYRLGVEVLSLALAMRSSNPVLQIASPLMRAASEKCHANVGLATADRDEMVYLESFRYNRRGVLRTVVSGQRVPIELTSLGLAYLAAAPEANRHEFIGKLRARNATRVGTSPEVLEKGINEAVAHVRQHGFCTASWQPEVIALASPVEIAGYPIYVVNMSVTGKDTLEQVVNELRSPLLALRAKIRDTMLLQIHGS
ncbi:MAG TPA: IclR family transcriptional regulator [Noviherbaspirillum sp.]